jgi:DNA-binding response OmpR family regulator
MKDDTLTVLIADDDPEILGIMAKRIAGEGYHVVTAQDGAAAWQGIQTKNPDIIVLDLMMPKMHGFDVLKNVRLQPPTNKWQPVIIVSGQSELEDMQKGFAMEADHYLTKPCKIEEIIKAIKLMGSLIPQQKTRKELEGGRP